MALWDFLTSPQAWIVFIVVFIISYNYIVKETWRGLPPGPPALPLVGSLPFLGSDIRGPFRKMAAKYGDVFTVYMGRERNVVLNGYDTVKEVHTRLGHIITAKPDNFYVTEFSKRQGLLTSSGPEWQEQRSFTLHALRDLGFGRPVMEDKILEEIQYFIQELHKQKDTPFFPLKLIQRSISNVIFSVLFGKRKEYTDPDYIKLLRATEEMTERLGLSSISFVFPFLRHLPGDMFKLKDLLRLLDDLIKEYQCLIDQHKTAVDTGEDPTDFTGIYLQKIEKERDNPESIYTDKQLCHVISDLFLGGSETTSTTLTWGILYLVLHQDVQARIQKEVNDVIGKGGIPSMNHRLNLPYTEACLNEIQRLADVAPFTVRRLTNDVTLKGYLVPEGTTILTNLNSINYDPRLWPEPEAFKPERFLDDDGKIRRREELIPFMFGKRKCIAEHLARMELFLYFTSMMANFHFRLAPGHPEPDRCGVMGSTNVPKPFNVIVETRG